MPLNVHIPGRPKTAEPAQLVELARTMHHPDVTRFGVTTTKEGRWTLLAVIKQGVKVPITEVEKRASKFGVIYLDDSGRMPVARPAYPALGE